MKLTKGDGDKRVVIYLPLQLLNKYRAVFMGSFHQLQDKFKVRVWSLCLYFDIVLVARRYSLCLTLASSATQRFTSVGMNVSNVERMVVCII